MVCRIVLPTFRHYLNLYVKISKQTFAFKESVPSSSHVTHIVTLIWKALNNILSNQQEKARYRMSNDMSSAQQSLSLTLSSLHLSIPIPLSCSSVVVIVRACSGVTMPNSNQSTDKRLLSFFAWFCVCYYMFPFHQHVLKSRSAVP